MTPAEEKLKEINEACDRTPFVDCDECESYRFLEASGIPRCEKLNASLLIPYFLCGDKI